MGARCSGACECQCFHTQSQASIVSDDDDDDDDDDSLKTLIMIKLLCMWLFINSLKISVLCPVRKTPMMKRCLCCEFIVINCSICCECHYYFYHYQQQAEKVTILGLDSR